MQETKLPKQRPGLDLLVTHSAVGDRNTKTAVAEKSTPAAEENGSKLWHRMDQHQRADQITQHEKTRRGAPLSGTWPATAAEIEERAHERKRTKCGDTSRTT
jgi:hypothetical protein